MNFLNKFALIGSITALSLISISCGENKNGEEPNPPVQGTPISISTQIIFNSPVINEFTQGHEMSIFVKKTSRIDSEDIFSNVKGTATNNSEWTINPTVAIPDNMSALFIFAVYPFIDKVDPTAYPINLDQQIDILYSGESVAVSRQTTTARLRMKHALAMMSFDIEASSYSGSGALTGIALDGNAVYSAGTMNVSTGKITKTKQGKVTSSENFNLKNNSAGTPNFWIIPFSTENEDAILTFTIDGKQYQVNVPPAKMLTGYQYQFHLILTDNGLVIMPEVGEISLNVDDDNFHAPEGFGIVKFLTSASSFDFPIFNGENVFGNVASGSESVNYTLGGTMNLSGSGNKTVTVETWSSTGFEIESLENIESIDISNY